eukprot:gene13803-4038_t
MCKLLGASFMDVLGYECKIPVLDRNGGKRPEEACDGVCPLSEGVPCAGHGSCSLDLQCYCSKSVDLGYWKGELCDACVHGYWGNECINECPGSACFPCN